MKYLILLLVISAPAQAAKVLYEINGRQDLVEIAPSGSVCAECNVLWDERRDGPLPGGAPVGYAERAADNSGKPILIQNSAKKADHDAKVQARLDKETNDAQDKAAFQALKLKVKEDTATAADVRRMLKFLLQKLGE